jgi:Protein of unknown function (DUF3460)
MYESDITKFMRELMQSDPSLAEVQKQNRATWWDKAPDSDTSTQDPQGEAPKQPYAYFPLPKMAAPVAKVVPANTGSDNDMGS